MGAAQIEKRKSAETKFERNGKPHAGGLKMHEFEQLVAVDQMVVFGWTSKVDSKPSDMGEQMRSSAKNHKTNVLI